MQRVYLLIFSTNTLCRTVSKYARVSLSLSTRFSSSRLRSRRYADSSFKDIIP